MDDFTVLTILGRGAFGEVYLGKHVRSGKLYALKSIAKDKIRGDKHI